MVNEIQAAAPSMAFSFLKINEFILEGAYYKALKETRTLIKHEQEMIENVTTPKPHPQPQGKVANVE